MPVRVGSSNLDVDDVAEVLLGELLGDEDGGHLEEAPSPRRNLHVSTTALF